MFPLTSVIAKLVDYFDIVNDSNWIDDLVQVVPTVAAVYHPIAYLINDAFSGRYWHVVICFGRAVQGR